MKRLVFFTALFICLSSTFIAFGEDFNVPKPKISDWLNLTKEEYQHRCVEDVKINWNLCLKSV